MKRNDRSRRLAFEQLESKAAPSSLLLAAAGAGTDTQLACEAANSQAAYSSQVSGCQYETEHILQFVADYATGGERSNRTATAPTAAQCAASDEMMQMSPPAWNSFLVIGFYDGATEL